MPHPATVLNTDMGIDITLVILSIVVSCYPHGVVVIQDITQQVFADDLFGDDLDDVAIAITANDKTVERIVLQTILTHEQEGVTRDNQMLDCLVDYDTVIGCRDVIHDDPFNLAERKVQLTTDLRRVKLTKLVVSYL